MAYLILSNITTNDKDNDPMTHYGDQWELFPDEDSANDHAKEVFDREEQFFLLYVSDHHVFKKEVEYEPRIIEAKEEDGIGPPPEPYGVLEDGQDPVNS